METGPEVTMLLLRRYCRLVLRESCTGIGRKFLSKFDKNSYVSEVDLSVETRYSAGHFYGSHEHG